MKSVANLIHPDLFGKPKRKGSTDVPPRTYSPEDFPTDGFMIVGNRGSTLYRRDQIMRVNIQIAFAHTQSATFSREKARALFLKEPDTEGLTILTDTDLMEESNE